MNTKHVYLILAILGAVVPYVFFIQHFQTSGFGIQTFIASVFANGAASGFGADLLISSLVFWIAMFELKRRQGGPTPWPFILITLLIGLSCALPLYLYARQTVGASKDG